MMCLKCGAMAVGESGACLAHGGRKEDVFCEYGEIHVDGEPCKWCDNSEGGH